MKKKIEINIVVRCIHLTFSFGTFDWPFVLWMLKAYCRMSTTVIAHNTDPEYLTMTLKYYKNYRIPKETPPEWQDSSVKIQFRMEIPEFPPKFQYLYENRKNYHYARIRTKMWNSSYNPYISTPAFQNSVRIFRIAEFFKFTSNFIMFTLECPSKDLRNFWISLSRDIIYDIPDISSFRDKRKMHCNPLHFNAT